MPQTEPTIAPVTTDAVRQQAENTAVFLKVLERIQPGTVDEELLGYVDAIASNTAVRNIVTAAAARLEAVT